MCNSGGMFIMSECLRIIFMSIVLYCRTFYVNYSLVFWDYQLNLAAVLNPEYLQ